MTTATAPIEHQAPRPLAEHRQAALDVLDTGSDGAVRVRIHDATRFEWAISIPLPARGHLAYTIEVELEVPTNAVVRRSPWEQIQTFTRLDEAHKPEPREATTIDTLRRGAVSLQRMLARAASGFARHVPMGALREAEDTEGDPYGFLVVWLETALYAVAEARQRLTQPASGDTAQVARERTLVDEYASVALLETLVEASRAVSEPPSSHATTSEALRRAFERVRARIDDAIDDEIAHRRRSGFLTMTEPSPTALDTYVARAARLKKHFEEVLFLDRESYQLDERVQQWMTSLAALIAGGSAFVLQLALLDERSSPTSIGSHLLAIAVIAGACYMARDRLKDLARTWLTGKVYRFHAQRVSRYRLPERMLATRDVFVRTREWCNQSTQSQPDVLNPEAGASLARTRIRYLQKGVVTKPDCLAGAGLSRVRHIARYDVSPLLPRLADDIKRVPFVGADGAVRVAEVPRRYQIPVCVRFSHGVKTHEERATLVLEKRGLTRMDKGTAPDAFTHDTIEKADAEP
ncbi:Hypothetical protein A7982_07609 [Minicystis rosea]|nr:Hypothetical protein A7982_07609 [Minicystis rosea]